MAVILGACESPRQSNGENTLPSGVKYKILKRDDKGLKIQNGDFIIYDIIGIVGKDTLINSYKLKEVQGMQVMAAKGQPNEVLPFLQVGDSVMISMRVDSLAKATGNPAVLEFKKKGDNIVYYLRIHKTQSKEEAQKEAMEKEKKAQAIAQEQAKKAEAEESGKLEEYATKSGIEFAKTASGLRYLVSTKKADGAQAKAGDSVTVHYTGKFLDGKVFDSSVNRGEPFQFVLGTGSVIGGWDEGIALLKKGEKATLLIPSALGYGAGGAGGGQIPPFTPLLFEVELIDIKSAKK